MHLKVLNIILLFQLFLNSFFLVYNRLSGILCGESLSCCALSLLYNLMPFIWQKLINLSLYLFDDFYPESAAFSALRMQAGNCSVSRIRTHRSAYHFCIYPITMLKFATSFWISVIHPVQPRQVEETAVLFYCSNLYPRHPDRRPFA